MRWTRNLSPSIFATLVERIKPLMFAGTEVSFSRVVTPSDTVSDTMSMDHQILIVTTAAAPHQYKF